MIKAGVDPATPAQRWPWAACSSVAARQTYHDSKPAVWPALGSTQGNAHSARACCGARTLAEPRQTFRVLTLVAGTARKGTRWSAHFGRRGARLSTRHPPLRREAGGRSETLPLPLQRGRPCWVLRRALPTLAAMSFDVQSCARCDYACRRSRLHEPSMPPSSPALARDSE